MRSCGGIPARNDEAMFVEEDDEEPDREQRYLGELGHVTVCVLVRCTLV